MITVIEICVLTYFMTYVFLFMGFYGNATYVMALLVAGILSLRGMNTGKGYRQADRFDELNPLYSMGFMREKSKHSKWGAYQKGIFFWQMMTLCIVGITMIALFLAHGTNLDNKPIVYGMYVWMTIDALERIYVVIVIGYIITRIYYAVIYNRSFRYYAGRDKIWKPFSFIGQDYYLDWPKELKTLPRNCASVYQYEENDNVKENIKNSCASDGYEKVCEFDFSGQGKVIFYKKTEISEVHILCIAETEILKDEHTKQLNDFFGEFWKENIGKEEKKQPIYFTFVIFCRRTDSLLAKQILEEANGLLMYRNRYRLGAIFSEKEYKLNIKQVSPKSHYKDIYRKMSGELRRFAGGDTEI